MVKCRKCGRFKDLVDGDDVCLDCKLNECTLMLSYIRDNLKPKEMDCSDNEKAVSCSWIDNIVSRVIFNNPATIIIWNDGTKTIVKCGVNDHYSEIIGLIMAYGKRMLSKNDYKCLNMMTDSICMVEDFKLVYRFIDEHSRTNNPFKIWDEVTKWVPEDSYNNVVRYGATCQDGITVGKNIQKGILEGIKNVNRNKRRIR